MLTQWCHVNEVTLMHNNKSCPLKYHVLSASSTGIIHCKSLSGSWRMYKSMAGHRKRLWYMANVHTLTLNLLTITDPRTKYNSAENEIWQKLKFLKCHQWDSNHGYSPGRRPVVSAGNKLNCLRSLVINNSRLLNMYQIMFVHSTDTG